MKYHRRVQDTPHPSSIAFKFRIWLDATDSHTFILNGSDVAQWISKMPDNFIFSESTAVNQPRKNGNEVWWDDPANDQWLTAGSNYWFIPAVWGGAVIYFLIRNSQVSPGGGQYKVPFDFGNHLPNGWGFRYASNEVGGYAVNREDLVRPVTSPTVNYVVAGFEVVFNTDQKLYINTNLENSRGIGPPALTAVEIAERPTRSGDGGPVTIGSASKANAASSRWFKGAIKNILGGDGVLDDYKRRLIFIYQRNKELV